MHLCQLCYNVYKIWECETVAWINLGVDVSVAVVYFVNCWGFEPCSSSNVIKYTTF